MIFKKISTLIVSKYHFILLTFVSCSSSSSFSTLRHIYSTISRSKDQFLSISLANNKIHSSIFFLPLFIPHSLLLSRRFLSNCPSLSLLFALFLFFYPPFFFLVICRGEAASAASSSIRRQIPTFCQRSARSHLQRSNKIKKPVTCTTGGKFPSPRGMSRPPPATGWKKKKKERVFKGVRLRASSLQKRLHNFESNEVE